MKHKTENYTSTYVFSAVQQEEVKQIYQKYRPPEAGKIAPSAEEEKMEHLRKLDKSVTRYGIAAALIVACLGALIHGIGIALVQEKDIFVSGMIVAIAGLILFFSAYPVYSYIAKRRQKKVESEILKLCEELMK